MLFSLGDISRPCTSEPKSIEGSTHSTQASSVVGAVGVESNMKPHPHKGGWCITDYLTYDWCVAGYSVVI